MMTKRTHAVNRGLQ